jgi:hypothetical protein
MDVVHLFLDRVFARRMKTAASGHIEEVRSGAVDFVDEVNESFGIICGGFEDGSASAVAENDAGSPVRVVDDRGHDI